MWSSLLDCCGIFNKQTNKQTVLWDWRVINSSAILSIQCPCHYFPPGPLCALCLCAPWKWFPPLLSTSSVWGNGPPLNKQPVLCFHPGAFPPNKNPISSSPASLSHGDDVTELWRVVLLKVSYSPRRKFVGSKKTDGFLFIYSFIFQYISKRLWAWRSKSEACVKIPWTPFILTLIKCCCWNGLETLKISPRWSQAMNINGRCNWQVRLV